MIHRNIVFLVIGKYFNTAAVSAASFDLCACSRSLDRVSLSVRSHVLFEIILTDSFLGIYAQKINKMQFFWLNSLTDRWDKCWGERIVAKSKENTRFSNSRVLNGNYRKINVFSFAKILCVWSLPIKFQQILDTYTNQEQLK